MLVVSVSRADFSTKKLHEDVEPNMLMLKDEIMDRLKAGATQITTSRVITRCLIACQRIFDGIHLIPENIQLAAIEKIEEEFKDIPHGTIKVKYAPEHGFIGSIYIEGLAIENEGSVHF